MKLNLIVIRLVDIDAAAKFYSLLGIEFEKHSHGGPEHYSSTNLDTVFELYPLTETQSPTYGVRLGFDVESDKVDQLMLDLRKQGGKIAGILQSKQFGNRIVVHDLEGHKIELTVK